MSLPVSQYEALLAEVRGLRRKAQRVQQLARPLVEGDSQVEGAASSSTTASCRHHQVGAVYICSYGNSVDSMTKSVRGKFHRWIKSTFLYTKKAIIGKAEYIYCRQPKSTSLVCVTSQVYA
ncbi:unnamed protein product [Acanthoscelides obtectus]|uniref:Uncharacterized protein n=1 Tax=Acanthoscelides obtectus TaxID=200917 RepID=A0A9P0MJL6_ACAOB|nr:unnamed protein product [Acanthoscelides obtectus]CAK1629807.1 hypothetical protein AOBTE_LOCUS5967 [Acanthoscelides obtectus]